MSTQLPRHSSTNTVLGAVGSAVDTVIGYLQSLIKWVLVTSIIGIISALWVNLIRIHLVLGNPNKAALTLGLLIFAVFASVGWLYQLGVFGRMDIDVLGRIPMVESTPS
jgi:hypothetical protein